MSPYQTTFCSAARKILDALLGFDPPWYLSGRAALWWLSTQTGPVEHLGLVWHCRDRLGKLSDDVRDRLEKADLVTAVLFSDLRRLWLIVHDAESACALRLTAEPAAPLALPWQVRLHDHFIHVESWRDIFQMTLRSLSAAPNPDDLGDLFLLFRRRTTSLDRGLLDALRRDPSFDPERLALSLAHVEVDEADLPPGVSLEEFGRFQQNLVVRILAWARSH